MEPEHLISQNKSVCFQVYFSWMTTHKQNALLHACLQHAQIPALSNSIPPPPPPAPRIILMTLCLQFAKF